MTNPDTLFPACCYTCPHYNEASGTCGHPMQQTIRHALAENTNKPCPVFQSTIEDTSEYPSCR